MRPNPTHRKLENLDPTRPNPTHGLTQPMDNSVAATVSDLIGDARLVQPGAHPPKQ